MVIWYCEVDMRKAAGDGGLLFIIGHKCRLLVKEFRKIVKKVRPS